MSSQNIDLTEVNQERKINIVLAAYNEEKNIRSTLNSIFNSNDITSVNVYIADDGSSDQTSAIVKEFQLNYPNLHLEHYNRLGKPEAIDRLIQHYQLNSKESMILFIDANIDLNVTCIYHLEKALNNSETGLVGASIYPINTSSNLEAEYILRENKLKSEEARVCGSVIGVFGACYAMKGELYESVPAHYITDDLFHTFSIIQKKKSVLYSLEAKAYEDIQTNLENEFKRKRRYAAGNFQILNHFKSLLNPINSSLRFIYCFFFHKIIRWISPILFFCLWIWSLPIFNRSTYPFIFLTGTIILIFMLSHYCLQKINKPIFGERIYYFFVMNLALLLGFFDYLKGIKTNVWERSQRN